MASVVFFLNLFLFSLALTNFFTIRKPEESISIAQTIDVLIPVRNEQENIPELVASLKAQINLHAVRFIFIDDSSTDNTASLIKERTQNDPRFSLISADPLPAGWLGKPWALSQGFSAGTGRIVITLDADVRLEPQAISSCVALLDKRNVDFISPYPRQLAISLSERLIQPLLQWSWLATVPLRIAEKSSRTSLAVATGQFFIAKRISLETISGFNQISDQVLDDIELSRALIGAGFHGMVVDGSRVATTRMYKSFSEIKNGYGKSLWKAFGSVQGSIGVVVFLAFTSIYPLYLALNLNPLGILALELIIGTRLLAAKSTQGNLRDTFLHPLSIAVLIYLILFSWRNRSTVQWKGRSL